MSTIDEIQEKNEQRKRGGELVANTSDAITHHGECAGVQSEGFVAEDCNCGLMDVAADIDTLLAEVDRWSAAESKVSDAYLRLRTLLGAFDTPTAPTSEQVYECTENALRAVLAEVDLLRDYEKRYLLLDQFLDAKVSHVATGETITIREYLERALPLCAVVRTAPQDWPDTP